MPSNLYKVTNNVDDIQASDTNQIIDALSGKNDIGDIELFKQINPPTAPVVAVNTNSGNLNGTYKYAVAFVTGYWKGEVGTGVIKIRGNTGGGVASNTVSPSSQQVDLSSIPVGSTGVIARIIYRTKSGGSSFFFLQQINDNVTTSWTDNVADASLTDTMPTSNTTGTKIALDSPDFTGIPTAPTATAGTKTTQIANTKFVDDALTPELGAKNWIPISLVPGTQIVNAPRKSRVRNIEMTGRTLINTIGRDGNPNYGNKFQNASQVTSVIDTTKSYIGTQSIKQTTQTANVGGSGIRINRTYEAGKYYIFRSTAWIDSGLLGGTVRIYLGTTVASFDSDKKNQWQTVLGKFAGDGSGALTYPIHVNDTKVGDIVWLGEFAIFEVSFAEYNAFDSLTEAQKNAKYPYVDDMKHINAVYARNPGKNQIPPFSEWTLHANCSIISPYEVVFDRTASGQVNEVGVKFVKGQSYTLTVDTDNASNDTYIHRKSDGARIAGILGSGSFTFTPDDEDLFVRFGASTNAKYTVKNMMLNIGSAALQFEPQQTSYKYLWDLRLHSNVDRSIADKLGVDEFGKPRVTRRFYEDTMDGSLAWTFDSDRTGFKRLKINSFADTYKAIIGANSDNNNLWGIKYNGTILGVATTSAADGIGISSSSSTLFLSVSDSDSGWGETYNPSADEIKAYFWGWKMNNGTFGTAYNGTGTKTWTKWNATSNTGAVTVVPTDYADSTYTPYRLMYQLAQSIDEAVSHEGELMLHDGPNQVEMGTGIVVREPITTFNSTVNFYQFNRIGLSELKNRVDRTFEIYKNNIRDRVWSKGTTLSNAYGNEYWVIEQGLLDQTKPYSVTYEALDKYLIGIAPLSISGEIAPNLKEAVDDLTRGLTEAKTQISVLQNVKDDKQKVDIPWITATLLSAWTGTLSYRRNQIGQLEIRGSITAGTVTALTDIAILPATHYPSRGGAIRLIVNSSGGTAGGELCVSVLGKIFITTGSTLTTGASYALSAIFP